MQRVFLQLFIDLTTNYGLGELGYSHFISGFTPTNFVWESYMSVTKSIGATDDLFEHKFRHPDSCEGWRVGAKLECADPDKPDLVHVATVTNMMENRVLIHFDGWSHSYDTWLPPSSWLLHPVGWCASHGGSVAPPLDSGGPQAWVNILPGWGVER